MLCFQTVLINYYSDYNTSSIVTVFFELVGFAKRASIIKLAINSGSRNSALEGVPPSEGIWIHARQNLVSSPSILLASIPVFTIPGMNVKSSKGELVFSSK